VNASVLADHFPVMVLLAFLISAFFALLYRDEPRARWRYFGRLFLGLVGGSLALAWLMFVLPPRR